jgi:hypothetical protein
MTPRTLGLAFAVLLVVFSPHTGTADSSALRVQDRAEAIAVQRAGLITLLSNMADRPEIFPPSALDQPRLLEPDARALVLSTWASFADRLLTIEQAAGDDPALHRAGFLARYRLAMEFIERVERDPGLDPLLNEPHPGLGLPERSYARLKLHYLNVARATEYSVLELGHQLGGGDTPAPLAAGASDDTRRILALGLTSGPRMTTANAAQVVEDGVLTGWLPVQERVARWAGDLRVHRNGRSLITPKQIEELQLRVEPGDILLQRREWYLTNAGIPGFWTHAALYVGTPEERTHLFEGDLDVLAWARAVGQGSFEAALRARHPEAYARSEELEAGHPTRVLEAIAEGVTFTSLEHSAAADSIAVLRPRLSKRELAIALGRAFGYAGRPYDYEFDFATDAALVCSELVYKSYQPGAGMHGLQLPLEQVAGHLMMTPNEIARRYTHTREETTRDLDFIWMLDGNERSGNATPASADTFSESWERPKWHILTAAPADLAGTAASSSDAGR